jgi:hypothetical protein
MKTPAYLALIVVLAGLNIYLLARGRDTQSEASVSPTESFTPGDTTKDDIHWAYAGCYTYPEFGKYVVPYNDDGTPQRSPLTLSIMFASATTCPAVLSEFGVFRRLVPILREHGQQVIATCAPADTLEIAALLKQEGLDIPLTHLEAEADDGRKVPIIDMGISPLFMPFKVLYDSTLTAIYVRGADNSPESQADFERAVLRLSSLVQRGEL